MLNLTQYWLSYGLEKVQNLILENTQNESSLLNLPLRKSPSLKFEGLYFERKIWICCQSHDFLHILMIKDSFGKLRTWGSWSNNFGRLFFLFNWKKKAMKNKRILYKQIHFGHFPSLSFGPSHGHNSVNIGAKSTSRTSFVN